MPITKKAKIVIDLDQTLTIKSEGVDYSAAKVNEPVAQTLREYHSQGFEIIIMTARNMLTHQGMIGKINAKTLPVIVNWLNENNIPYDEIHVGKPWCGNGGFYVDDKAIRPQEFTNLSYKEILALI